MTDWRDHLTPDETKWLTDYEQRKIDDRREWRKIFDRARKRALRDTPTKD